MHVAVNLGFRQRCGLADRAVTSRVRSNLLGVFRLPVKVDSESVFTQYSKNSRKLGIFCEQVSFNLLLCLFYFVIFAC